MGDIGVIMPVIAAVGTIVFIIVLLIVIGMIKREQIKNVDVAQFNRFAEEMKRENAEMKKDLQSVKDKVESIDEMMKDI